MTFDVCTAVQAAGAQRGGLPATGGRSSLLGALAVVAAALALRTAMRRPQRAGALLVIGALVASALVTAVGPRPAAAACASARPTSTATGPGPLAFSATVLPGAGGEPNVSISPDGRTVLVAGLGGASPANLFRSTDGGVHFAKLNAVFAQSGGGDFDLRFLDDHTVIAADLSVANGIFVHRSTDAGAHWTTTTIHTDTYDRPWIEHFGPSRVYVVAKGFDGVPYLYISNDGGQSFGSPVPVPLPIYGTGLLPKEAGGTSPTPVEMLSQANSYVDHVVVDPVRGDLYVLYGIDGIDAYAASPPAGYSNRLYVAHLENGAMVSRPVVLGSGTDSFISGFNWITVDSAGTVYVLGNGAHNGHHSARLWYSKDHGVTWAGGTDLGLPGAANVYGSIAGGDPGVLSLVMLRGSNENPDTEQNWYAEMDRVAGASSGSPTVERTRPVAAPLHQRDICFSGILCGAPGFGSDRNLLDFIWNAVGPDGTAYAVVASDGPATGHSKTPRVRPDVIVLRQSGGLSHGRGAPS